MTGSKIGKRACLLISVIITVLFALCACITFLPVFNQSAATADTEKVSVTSVKGGKVTVGELVERHDFYSVILPNSYYSNGVIADPKLKALADANIVNVYKFEDSMVVNNNTLLGWKQTQAYNNANTRVLLVVPKTVTAINWDTTSPNTSLLADAYMLCGGENMANLKRFTGIMFEDTTDGVSSFPANRFASDANFYCCILPSSVKKIADGTFQGCTALQDVVMPGVTSIGSNAFNQCYNLYHISLPSTLTSIGSNAFANTYALCDIENNSNSITASSHFPYAMNIYGLSSTIKTQGQSYLHVYENYSDAPVGSTRKVNTSLVFSYNNLRTGTLATTTTPASTTVDYKKQWYFITVSGIEDKSIDFSWLQTTEYHFPNEIDLTSARDKITYDYLGSDGFKYVNRFAVSASGTLDKAVTKYDISYGACYNRGVPCVILPSDAVTVIGDRAFYGSQVGVADIGDSVTTIGASAFRVSHRNKTNNYFYIRKKDPSKLNVGNLAFGMAANWNNNFNSAAKLPDATRTFIFANKAAFDIETAKASKYNSAGDSTISYTYLVPINTVEVNEDNTENKTLFGYRLHGHDCNYVQQSNYRWGTDSTITLPTLEGYSSTVWYHDHNKETDTYSNVVTTGTISSLLKSNDDAEINLYTKKIAEPNFSNKEFTFNKEVDAGKSLTFKEALGFTEQDEINYNVESSADFEDWSGNTGVQSVIQNAGTYKIKVILNSKWGVWDDSRVRTYTVLVNRAKIDITDINELPQFETNSGTPLGGTGEGATLYHYTDGWYLYAKSDSSTNITATVLNSYARYTGGDITISAKDGKNRFSVVGNANTTGKESAQMLAAFTLSISDPNYIFTFDESKLDRDLLSKYGISFNMAGVNDNVSAINITKTWYIVQQQNYFIDSTSTGTDEKVYYMLTQNTESSEPSPISTIHYEAIFDSQLGNYTLHMPKIAKGETSVGITFTVEYFIGEYEKNGDPITMDDNGALVEVPIDRLPDYVNSSMPAGNYLITIKAGAATDNGSTLPEFNEEIKLSVTRNALDTAGIQELLTGEETDSTGAYVGNTFEHVYDNGAVHLLDDANAASLKTLLENLESKLNTVRKNLAADSNSVWKLPVYDKYYNTLSIEYNLDRMQSSVYYTEDELKNLNSSRVPSNVDRYIIYYSLSALNYNTVGGASAANRRDYRFNTIIFRELSTTDFALGATIKDQTYTGSVLYPDIPYSQYYTHGYTDVDYINAGEKIVTFTLNDPVLSHWTDANKPANVTLTKTADGKFEAAVTVKYNILKADNGWNAAPQMPSWSFNGFNVNINKVSSSLKLSNSSTVITYYIVNTDNKYLGKNGVDFVDDIKDAFSFTVTSASEDAPDLGGQIVDDESKTIEKTLRELKPGTYYLASHVEGDRNINSYTTPANVRNTLIISKANNRWTSTPYILPWTWGEYNATRNTVSAVSLYPNILSDFNFGTTHDVQYQILKRTVSGNTVSDTKITGLSQNAGGEDFWFAAVDYDIANILKDLDAGRYVLRAKLDGNDYYGDIEFSDTQFDIAVAQNRWQFSPNIVRWEWGNYNKTVNTISATPLYTNDGLTVKYTVLDSDYASVNAALTNFTSITEAVENAFKALGAGNYFIVASYPGSNNFNAINDWGDDYDFADPAKNQKLSPVQFNIGVLRNTWKTTPGVTGWQYRSFTVDNFIFGIPENKEDIGNVNYKLYRSDNASFTFGGTSGTSFDISKVTADTAIGYTVTDGVPQLTKATVAAFKELYVITKAEGQPSAASYVVDVKMECNNNYSEITASATFSVIKASNTWSTRPVMTSWMYGEFTVLGNFTAGVPTIADTYETDSEGHSVLASVKYTVSGNKLDNDLVLETEKNADGETVLTEASVEELKKLGVADYVLTVEYGGTDNYDALTLPINFAVTAVTNTWKTTPSLTGWTYKSFTDGLFRAGVPTLNDGNVPVKYTLYAATENGEIPADHLIEFTSLDTVVDAVKGTTAKQYLKALGYAEYGYILVASLDKTDNYSELSLPITFRVSKLTNTWDPTPAMSGWVYNGFAVNNFRPGTPTTQESKEPTGEDAVVKYTIEKLDLKEGETFTPVSFTDITDVEALLKAFNAGNYRLTATYAGTNNYDAISYPVEFAVSAVQNTWTTSPRLTSYQYKKFDASSNFIGGVPQYPAENKAVYYAILTGSAPETVDTLDAFNALPGVHFVSISDTSYTLKTADTSTVVMTSVVDYLNSLAYDSNNYVFAAFAVGADNYTCLYATSIFSVTGTANAWVENKLPSVSGWTYGGYNDSFTDGEALFGTAEIKYTVQKVTVVDNTEVLSDVANYTALGYAALNSKIKDLGAGTYNLHAYIEATDNYAGVTHNVRFIVSKAENEWATGHTPVLSLNNWKVGDTVVGVPTEPLVKFESDSIGEYKTNYYVAVNNSYNENAPLPAAPTDAGYYVYVVVAPETDNYNSLKNEFYFTISAASNSWVSGKNPEDILTWVWGKQDDILTAANKLINAEALHGTDAIVYTVRRAGGDTINFTENGEITPTTKANVKDRLSGLGTGVYTIVTTVLETPNYAGVSASTTLTVTNATLTWGENTSFADKYGWTWGDAGTDKSLFGEPNAKPAKTDDVVEISYNVYKVTDGTRTSVYDDADVTGNSARYTAMVNTVKVLGAGNYEIVVTASCENHNDLSQTVDLDIAFADFVWSGDVTNVDWTYGDEDTVVSDKLAVNNLTVTLKDGNAALEYEVYYSGNRWKETEITDYASLIAQFQSDSTNHGTYSVNIKASLANYNDSVKTFTITINSATNTWKDGFAPSNLTRDYGKTLENVVIPKARFGTVAIKDEGGADITGVFANWVNVTCNNAGVYKFTVTVEADANGNYSRLSEEHTLTVVGMGGGWNNADRIVNEVTFGYDELPTKIESVEIPYKTWDHEELQLKGASLSYYLNFTPYDSTQSTPITDRTFRGDDAYTNIKNFMAEKNADGTYKRDAGVYTIQAVFDPNSTNYAKLDTTITITVNKAVISWKEQTWNYDIHHGNTYTYDGYKKAYQGFSGVPTPSVAEGEGHVVRYRISQAGKDDVIVTDIDFADYLNGLGVGTYTIRYSVAPTNNYTGLDEVTITVVIDKAAISWTNDSALSYGDYTKYVDEDYDIVVPVSPLLSPASLLIIDNANTGNRLQYSSTDEYSSAAINAWLKTLTNNHTLTTSAAGYKLEFKVDESANYNGLTYTVNLYLNKHANSATTDISLSTETITYGDHSVTVAAPVFAYGNDAVTYTWNGAPITFDEIEQRLSSSENLLNAGEYNIVASVAETDTYLGATSSVKLTVNKFATDWTADTKTAFEAYESISEMTYLVNVNYGDTPNLPIPKINWAGGVIIYSIDGTDLTEGNWNTALNGKGVGTYTVTARVKGDINHADLAALSVRFVVNAAGIKWANGIKDTGVTWTFDPNKAYDVSALVEPTLINSAGCEVKFTFNGSAYTGTWTELLAELKNQNVGTYTVVAHAGSGSGSGNVDLPDDITYTVTINPITVGWLLGGEPVSDMDLGSYRSISVYFNSFDGVLPDLKATHNKTVKFYIVKADGDEAIVGDWNDYIKGLNASDTAYKLKAVVELGDDGNYVMSTDELDITLTINKKSVTWNSGTRTDVDMSWAWDGEHTIGIVEPGLSNSDTNVTVTYVYSVDGNKTTWSDIIDAISKGDVGRHTVTITPTVSEANKDNYTLAQALTYVFTITRKTVTWNKASTDAAANRISWMWNASHTYDDDIAEPELNDNTGCTIDYRLVRVAASGDETIPTVGKSWTDKLDALKTQNVGTYKLIAEVSATSNYDLPAALEYNFVINKAVVSWSDNTNREFRWTWNATGNYEEVTLPTLGDANCSLKFVLDGDEYTAWTGNNGALTAVKGKPVGEYTITIKANVTDSSIAGNYDLPGDITYKFYIATRTVNWTEETLTSNKSFYWVWNKEHNYDMSNVKKPELTDNTDCTIVYTLNGASVDTWDNVLETIQNGNAIRYTLVVSVNAPTGITKPQTTLEYSFDIRKKTVAWTASDTTFERVYNDGHTYDNISAPTLDDTDVSATFNYVLPGLYSGSVWTDMMNILNARDAGTYTITITATENSGNYAMPDEITYTVVVKPITLTWKVGPDGAQLTDSEIANNYASKSMTYGSTDKVLPVLSASNGSPVKYALAGSTDVIDDWNEYIKTLDVSDTPYKFTATVDAGVNYTGLSFTIDLTVTKKAVDWNNATRSATKRFDWTWNASGAYSGDIVEPKLDNADCSVQFTYSDNVVLSGSETWENIINAIKRGNAGTYTVTATPSTTNNYDLAATPYTYTFNIAKIQVAWRPETVVTKDYTWIWNSDKTAYGNVVAPELNNGDGVTVTYAIADESGSYTRWSDVIDQIKNKNARVEAYKVTVTPSVAASVTDNYVLPDPLTYTFTISEKAVAWDTNTLLAARTVYDWIWNKDGSYTTVAAPTHNGGEGFTLSYVLTTGSSTSENFAAWFTAEGVNGVFDALKAKPAGSYTIRVTMSATGSYTLPDDLEYRFNISEKSVDWTTDTKNAVKSFTWTWNANQTYNNITAPVLDDTSGATLSFVLRKTGASGTLLTSDDWNEIYNELIKQTAGMYTIGATATAASANYNVVADVLTYTVTIERADNGWVKQVGKNVSIVFGTNEYKDGDTTKYIEYQAEQNNDNIAYNIDGTNYTADNFINTVKTLGVGSHTIVVTVPETDTYEGLVERITVTVVKQQNGWVDNKEMTLTKPWTWDNGKVFTAADIGWTTPVPMYGNTVNITVKHDTVVNGSTVSVIDINMPLTYTDRVVNQNDLTVLMSALAALDVLPNDGVYTITAAIPESVNYDANAVTDLTFTVKQATNDWRSIIDRPHISGWDFGGTTAYPDSTPIYGNKNDVVYSYAPVLRDDNGIINDDDPAFGPALCDWKEALPVDGGHYYIRGMLAGTVNYTSLVGYGMFSIKVSDNAWWTMPGVIEWNWNGYDRTVNVFSGSARNGGEVTFTINKSDNNGGYIALSVDDFEAFGDFVITSEMLKADETKLVGFGFEKIDNKSTKYISEARAKLLNALKPGVYTLHAHVDATDNYDALDLPTTFRVSNAANEWASETKIPNVLSFVYENVIESGARMSFTAGVTKYGENNVWYKVVGTDNDGNEIDSSKDIGNMRASAVVGYLKNLAAGNYNLQAWADGGDTYNSFYTENAPYSKPFNVTRAQNAWKDNFAPKDSIEVKYSDLQATEQLETLFTAPVSVGETVVVYDILNDNQSVLVSNVAYADLLNALKNLPFGRYIIRSRVEQSCNYMSMSGNTALSVTRESNKLYFDGKEIKDGVEVSGQWRETDGNDLSKFKAATADHYEDIIYTYAGDRYLYNTAALAGKDLEALDLQDIGIIEFMQKQNAGTYNINATVEGTNTYEGCSGLITLVIAPAQNEWLDGWTIEKSVKFEGKSVATWKWASAITWLGAKTKYGSSIEVTIRNKNAVGSDTRALFYSLIDTKGDNFDTQVAGVSNALSALNVGSYYISVKAPRGTNWEELNTELFELRVEKNETNKWTSSTGEEEKPKFTIQGETVTEWNYGMSATIVAHSVYGEYQVKYYAVKDNGDIDTSKAYDRMPVNAGSYAAVFNVPQDDNYNELTETVKFTINKVYNREYSVVPGIIEWTWNEYDPEVNLFTGLALSGAPASFTVVYDSDARAANEVVSIGGEKLENIELVDKLGDHTSDVSQNLYVPKKYAELLGQLLAGKYKLVVNFAATINYLPFSSEVPFAVELAHNEWTTIPSVAPWSVGSWTAASKPKAETKHGKPSIRIVADSGKYVVYSSVWNEERGEYVEVNRLSETLAGWYTMTASVGSEEGKYDQLPDYTYRFQIFLEGTELPANRWSVAPDIKWWNANVNNTYGEISGTPVRGKPYFEFYEAERVDGELKYDLTKMIKAGPDVVTVEKGDTYYKDFYVPMKPGSYVMIAKSEYVNIEGTYVDSDYMESGPIYFIIGNRENSFEQDIRIDTVLYLGEMDHWDEKYPTAIATLKDSVLTYEFIDTDTGVSFGSKIPDVPGTNYMVTVTAKAMYSDPVTSSIKFTVAYSQNSWVDDQSPTIDGWSEEFSDKAPDPVGQAKFGTIVYTYANILTPNDEHSDKPLTAGTYIMYARVVIPGYNTLESTCTFTIEEAFDRTFVLIDIILGSVACALAVVVIIFAIRRYKENG